MTSVIKNIVCAISGGVDSCVAALLLKRKGYQVQGVFMRNWDIADETGYCQADKDQEDAEYICRKIGIPLFEVNFVKEFWNNVFSNFLQDYMNGLTPNPDIICNRIIKFNLFSKYALEEMQADAIATGHYARIWETADKKYHLIKAIDENKDQTFFLSQIPRSGLERCLFPLGNLNKNVVKRIASEAGLEKIANKKESTGICFVGKRNFQSFIEEYIKPQPGVFIDIETGSVVGKHNGIHCWTVGQRCHLPGLPTAYFVVEKCYENQDILVASNGKHPSLYSQSLITNEPHWITPNEPCLSDERAFECDFRFQHRNPLVKCLIYKSDNGHLQVLLASPLKALTPGQYAVFYRGQECLGGARIITHGPSLYQLEKAKQSLQ